DAKDVTQAFFAKLLEKHYLRDVHRDRGRFRSFLLVSFRHFIANERNRARAQKRGGGKHPVSFEAQSAETMYSLEPAHDTTPERIFERGWAVTLLEQTIKRLRKEHVETDRLLLFEELKGVLTGDANATPYAEIGVRLEMTEGAVKVAAHRLRRRYRHLLRQTIADTVATPDQIDDELRHLFGVLTS
ncbi:MAG: sigma-70 family RNA polymerase sigma factor, partial [Lentisphaerae bacterium]|nr:sigma-70 family RNA polymerase sigma factor [Lentisphaerota bacterium]